MGKAQRRYLRAISRFQKIPESQSGTLGNSRGIVLVPDKTDMVYVTLPGTGTREVYNKRVANVPGSPVKVGYDPLEPKIYQVLGTISYPQPSGSTQYTKATSSHGFTHNWAGGDTVWVDKRQMMPLRVTPLGGMEVYLSRDVFWSHDSWSIYTGHSVDLTDAVPVTGSYYAMIYANPQGGSGIITGTLRDLLSLSVNDVPNPLPGTVPLAMIRLYAGQTGIIEGLNDTDVIDVRESYSPAWSNVYITGSFNVDTSGVTEGEALVFTSGTWGPGGSFGGDVIGPASATDENIVVFDSTSGKIIKDSGHQLSEYAELAGATFTGDITISKTTASPQVWLNSNAGYNRAVNFQSAGVLRWVFRTNDEAESGSDAGSNFEIVGRHDDGSAAGTYFRIIRATGYVNFTGFVGMGIAPTSPLHIYSNAVLGVANIKVQQNHASGFAYLQLDRASTARLSAVEFSTANVADWWSGILYNGGVANLGWSIGTSNTLGANTKLHITTNGSVLIGTTTDGMTASGSLAIAQDLAHRGTKVGFYNTASIVKQTGVAVTAAAIHAALVNLGLISA